MSRTKSPDLSSTTQKFFSKNFFGFDIETYDNNKKFLMASIVGYTSSGKKYEKVFFSPEEVIKELKTKKCFRNAVVFATNLSFDFFGTFFSSEESEHFKTVFRGSDLLYSETFFEKGNKFTSEEHVIVKDSSKIGGKKRSKRSSLIFLDTLNYAKMSVDKMGEILKFPKLEHPSFLGQRPKDDYEWAVMTEYNIRDSWVTYEFMKFLIKAFEDLGATFKLTIASTSVSLFKNKYLGDYTAYGTEKEVLIDIFKAYYGGRTETFRRGHFENVNYYDFNSLYPSVMEDKIYPDPNSLHTSRSGDQQLIADFEGVSDVDIYIPKQEYPPIPVRLDSGKVIFPYGRIKGWYSHAELRHAVYECNAKIINVRKTYYYTESMTPFKAYVNDLYALRNKYKKENNPLEVVVKLFMNSLYGKFGEKFLNKTNTVHQNSITLERLEQYKSYERVGEYFTVTEDREPRGHCIPIWAVYVSAYGRIKLHKALSQHETIYCDTDSLITKDTIETSKNLGDLKLEMEVDEGVAVRPKFYAIKGREDDKETECVKIKGLGKRLTYFEFMGVTKNPFVEYTKFAKFKESLRRNFIPNEIVDVHKEFSLEDTKRDWKGQTFNPNSLQTSDPNYVHMFEARLVDQLESIDEEIYAKSIAESY